MRECILIGVLCTATLMVGSAQAGPVAQVELLQAQAWLIRDGRRESLRLESELQPGDRIETGRRARTIVRLGEGSTVKLGANARLDLRELKPPSDDAETFGGFLDVIKGAFRFTTTTLGKNRRRNITARLRTATVGIRGTDVWGKVEDARDFVVLLEGKIDIERDGETTTLETPLSLFMAPRGAAAEPIRPVDRADLERWAQETEPQPGAGIQSAGGKARLNLASFKNVAHGDDLVKRLAIAGYTAKRTQVMVNGRDWSRVSLPYFAERDDARAALKDLRELETFAQAWIDEP